MIKVHVVENSIYTVADLKEFANSLPDSMSECRVYTPLDADCVLSIAAVMQPLSLADIECGDHIPVQGVPPVMDIIINTHGH